MSANEIETLITLLSKLPTLGPRSARRAVLYLLNKKESQFIPLIAAMQEVSEKIKPCAVCGNMDTSDPCSICRDARRTPAQICVVQDVADLWALERAGMYHGRYHVLGGVLSALDGVGPDELKIPALVERVKKDNATEVVLALPATIEGQTTAHYVADKLADTYVQISTLSRGVPMGGELDYLDDGTLQLAFQARKKMGG